MNEKCFNMSSGLTRLCENKEITLTHDFNRRNLGKNQTVFLTVSTVLTIFTQPLNGRSLQWIINW